MPLQATSGAASYDAFGGGVPFEPNYIESVFSTYLYTGNGSTQTITNGIDLAGEGGLVWIKARNQAYDHRLLDTIRGPRSFLVSNDTSAATLSTPQIFSSYNSDGFSLNDNFSTNNNNDIFASWTFRKAPKFFDVVTYTGTGSPQNIAHNLGSTPGFFVVKRIDGGSEGWNCYHRSLGSNALIFLNYTDGQFTPNTNWNNTAPTDTHFTVSGNSSVNRLDAQYVAYLFAHDAGGFGLTGTDNVISCGSFTTNGATQDINLGYEPQFVIIKRVSSSGSWQTYDVMRGWNQTGINTLYPDTSWAENPQSGNFFTPTATGFQFINGSFGSGDTFIYIAIRRGPMKVPTTGTSVFSPTLWTTPSSPSNIDLGFPADAALRLRRTAGSPWFISRLTGGGVLNTSDTDAEATNRTYQKWDYQNGYVDNAEIASGQSMVIEGLRRAPGFFDVVCYTGTGSNRTVAHNLAAVPELIIVKRRDTTGAWDSYSASLANTEYVVLNTTAAKATGATRWNSTSPTATVFSLGTEATVNASGGTYVAYLFASCPGVSKVGSYTGTGTTQQINCGFSAGARFVLIKRTDSTGDWYVWDSARGIVAGNDPYLLLNSTAAEVTNTDYVDTFSAGFEISSTAPAAINASGGSFIFLAIA